jgi:hypothetical protein
MKYFSHLIYIFLLFSYISFTYEKYIKWCKGNYQFEYKSS